MSFITVTYAKSGKTFAVNTDQIKVVVQEDDDTATIVMASNGTFAHTIETEESYAEVMAAITPRLREASKGL